MSYRPYLTDGGEPLHMVADPFLMAERLAQLTLDLGVERSEVWVSAVSCVPLPLHNPDRGRGGSASDTGAGAGWPMKWPDGRPVPSWPNANPEFLWNPLCWLPDELAYTVDISDESGTMRQESLEEWSLRVVLALETVGLYVPGEGWLDVLAPAGIDTATSAGLDRVKAWLAGAPDEVLDTFTLDHMFSGNPKWSLQECFDIATELGVLLLGANLALAAHRTMEYTFDIGFDDVPMFLFEVESLAPIWLPGIDMQVMRTFMYPDEALKWLQEQVTVQYTEHADALEQMQNMSLEVEQRREAARVGQTAVSAMSGSVAAVPAPVAWW